MIVFKDLAWALLAIAVIGALIGIGCWESAKWVHRHVHVCVEVR